MRRKLCIRLDMTTALETCELLARWGTLEFFTIFISVAEGDATGKPLIVVEEEVDKDWTELFERNWNCVWFPGGTMLVDKLDCW